CAGRAATFGQASHDSFEIIHHPRPAIFLFHQATRGASETPSEVRIAKQPHTLAGEFFWRFPAQNVLLILDPPPPPAADCRRDRLSAGDRFKYFQPGSTSAPHGSDLDGGSIQIWPDVIHSARDVETWNRAFQRTHGRNGISSHNPRHHVRIFVPYQGQNIAR